MKEGLWSVLRRLHQDECGQDLIEYAFVAALIAFGSIASMQNLASNLNTAFSKIGSEVVTSSKG